MLSGFGDERKNNKGQVVALIQITKDGEAKILEGKSLVSFLELWEVLAGLLTLREGSDETISIFWTPLQNVKVERKKK